ncbi:MAG TPA: ATP-binding cassette domain-containing protein, partial [Acidobacteria bacterium]|nr:ATP-binding cassette domain-containing protein [Acidobacteriota bacterium]
DGLSFDVPRGSIFGLLGPNGAGKTTTIRMVMRIILPDAGRVLLDGEPVDDDRRRRIGYLPEERGLYRKMKVLDHLVFLGTVRGVPPGEARRRASAWLDRFGLGDWATHKVEGLSKGMQQKVQFIGTILHRPELLILDEPFSGLDPINTRELKDLMLAMRDEGVTIVLSTHVLPQVDELCDHICLINQARPILTGKLDEIRERFGGRTWEVEGDFSREQVEHLPQVEGVHPLRGRYLVDLNENAAPRDLLTALLELGEVRSFARFVPDLENIFIRAVEEDRTDA